MTRKEVLEVAAFVIIATLGMVVVQLRLGDPGVDGTFARVLFGTSLALALLGVDVLAREAIRQWKK